MDKTLNLKRFIGQSYCSGNYSISWKVGFLVKYKQMHKQPKRLHAKKQTLTIILLVIFCTNTSIVILLCLSAKRVLLKVYAPSTTMQHAHTILNASLTIYLNKAQIHHNCI